MKDLLIVAADKNMQQALIGLLDRPEALLIRDIEVDIYPHHQRDPGCALRGVEFMSDFSEQYNYGLLIFDHEGSGSEQIHPHDLEKALNGDFPGQPGETVLGL